MTITIRIPPTPTEREYVDVRIEVTPEYAAEIRRQLAPTSVGYTITSER